MRQFNEQTKQKLDSVIRKLLKADFSWVSLSSQDPGYDIYSGFFLFNETDENLFH